MKDTYSFSFFKMLAKEYKKEGLILYFDWLQVTSLNQTTFDECLPLLKDLAYRRAYDLGTQYGKDYYIASPSFYKLKEGKKLGVGMTILVVPMEIDQQRKRI